MRVSRRLVGKNACFLRKSRCSQGTSFLFSHHSLAFCSLLYKFKHFCLLGFTDLMPIVKRSDVALFFFELFTQSTGYVVIATVQISSFDSKANLQVKIIMLSAHPKNNYQYIYFLNCSWDIMHQIFCKIMWIIFAVFIN